MQDQVKTFEIFSPKIKLPKHGYTKIELKDPYTCKKQVFESENMLTNAAENYFVNGGFFNRLQDPFSANDTSNIIYNMFGGVMLFDDEIPENANNTGIPAANMTANMAVDVTNNTNPPELGSYSATESGWQQDGSWVQTYDFTTTQGNGDIASACLTSRWLGGIGVGNPSDTSKSTFQSRQWEGGIVTKYTSGLIWFKIDYTNSIGYCVDASDVDVNVVAGNTIRVYKYLLPLTIIDLKDRLKLLETYTFTVPQGVNLNKTYSQLNIEDGKFFISGRSSSAYTWSGLQLLLVDETGIQFYNYNTPPVEGLMYYYSDAIHVVNGAFYCEARTASGSSDEYAKTIYKVRLSDGALLKTITNTILTQNIWNNARANAQIVISDNQTIYVQSGAGVLFDFVNDRIMRCNTASQSNEIGRYRGKIIGADGLVFSTNPYQNTNNSRMITLFRNPYKIMSINNLDSTVTKTPDKTMKVTYRITF